jgi:CubicO group peptidase (beta-lactamase class C family)
MRKLSAILSLCVLISIAAKSQDSHWNTLTPYFDSLEIHNKFMGNIAVLHDGEWVFQRAMGYAQIENSIRAQPQTVYRIGSISKTFTAAMIFQLIEQGVLDLHQNISAFFPQGPWAKDITIAHLLGHRSGLYNFTDSEDYLSWNTEPKTEDQMMEIILTKALDFVPDSAAAYSNTNYLLLSYLLEKIYDKSFADILEEKICVPLGLSNTYFGYEKGNKAKEASSYFYKDDWQLQTETHLSIAMGGGGILSTAEDLAKFAVSLFNSELIGKESLALMTSIREGMGMGLFQFPLAQYSGFGHTGGIDGFTSILTYFKDLNLCYAMVCNGANYNTNDISLAVLGVALGQPVSIPSFQIYAIEESQLLQYTGIYSAEKFPLSLSITSESGVLKGQATGQSSFELRPTGPHIFRFDPAGIKIEFHTETGELTLIQMGMSIRMIKN